MQLEAASVAGLLALGLAIGAISGMLGIGGGVLLIPALVVLFKFSHAQAVGTSLGMLLPPIGLFAFLAYYRAGNVNLPAAALCAAGFAAGAYVGAKLVVTGVVPEAALRTLFALFMLYVAATMLFRGEPRVWAATCTVTVLAVALGARLLLKRLARRWEKLPPAAEMYRERIRQPFQPDYEI